MVARRIFPHLLCAAVEGRLLRGINIARLRDTPAEWSRQFEARRLVSLISQTLDPRSSFSNELRRTRQDNPDIGEFAGLCVDLNGPRMLLHDDVVTDGQAQSGSFADGLGR
jgi:hypothetical protein